LETTEHENVGKTKAKRLRPRCEGLKCLNRLQDSVRHFGLYNITRIRVEEKPGDKHCTGTENSIRSIAEAERRRITY
jgi:hypothetical protein